MNDLLISVIVPVYNTEKFLDECVESIVGQTYKNLEIILVDDGSIDSSPKICDEWAERDPRIKVIHKENAGASAARNMALDIAKGDYIGFVDSDDYIDTRMYEKMLSALLNSDKKMACCSAYAVFNDGAIVAERNLPKKGVMDFKKALEEIFYFKAGTSFWRRLFEKSIFDDIRFPEGETNEEFSILIPSTVKANGMVHIGESFYYYRKHGNNTTNNKNLEGSSSRFVYKNLNLMETQLLEYNLSMKKSFNFFRAACIFDASILMEKYYDKLSFKVMEKYKKHRKIMRKDLFWYIFSKYSTLKDKILYLLILSKLLRPIYKLFNKPL